MTSIRAICTAVTFTFLSATTSFAAQFNYTISGTGSGSLGGIDFIDEAFSFSLLADTENLDTGFAIIFNPLEQASFDIGGIVGDFLVATQLGLNEFSDAIFFSLSGGLDLFDFEIAPGLDFASAFAPISGSNVFALEQFEDIATTAGLLSFDASSDVQFSSVAVEPSVAAVPLPAGAPLLLIGLAGLALARRRQRAS